VSAGETELRRGIAVLDQYRAQIETLAQQQEIVRISLEEHMRARETLLRYREAGKAAEVLVPIGANSFLVAESKDIKKAFVSIGSDLLVYDEMDRQVERLDARINSGICNGGRRPTGRRSKISTTGCKGPARRASGARCSSPFGNDSPAGKRRPRPK